MSKGSRVLITCATCGEEKWKAKSKTGKGKNGLNFCNRECKDKAQKIGGPIAPEHNGRTNDYRTKAFRSLPHLCNRCGYCKNKSVLQVHHRDEDRTNHELFNLEIICPTCHVEIHTKKV